MKGGVKGDLAEKIADVLFFDCDLHEGKRLAIVVEEGPSEYMAGWCKRAAIREIRRIIRHHTPPLKVKG